MVNWSAGDRRGGAEVESDGPDVPADAGRLSRGPNGTVHVQSAPRQHHLHAAGLQERPGRQLVPERPARAVQGALLDVAYVENRGKNMLLFANYNQAARTTRRDRSRSRRGVRSRNGATSRTPTTRQVRVPGAAGALRGRLKFGLMFLARSPGRARSTTARARSKPGMARPEPQDFTNPEADYGYSADDSRTRGPRASAGSCRSGRAAAP